MKEIPEFLRRLWRHWVLLITGSGAVALLAVWEHYTGRSLDPRLYAALAGGLFLWACFLVWREERRRGHTGQAPSESAVGATSSELQLTIDWVWVAREAESPDEAQVILVAQVTNPGRPNTADRWTLVAQSSDGKTKQANVRKIPAGLAILQDREPRQFGGGDALYEKAFAAPIPTGGMVRGVLWFHLPGTQPEEINKRCCYLVVHASDAFGKQITAAATFGPGHGSVPVVFAGLGD